MGLLSWLLQPSHPKPFGEQTLGCVRTRLPPLHAGKEHGLLVQVHYPADAKPMLGSTSCCSKNQGVVPACDDEPCRSALSFPWLRREIPEKIAESYNVPVRLMTANLANCKQLDACRQPIQNGNGWPIILFSSGLYGCCEMYTQFCRELASKGAIVLAIEHEDGSGVYATSSVTGEVIKYVQPPEECDIVSFRAPFLEKRVIELENSAAVIIAMTKGNVEECANPDQALLGQILRCGDPEKFLLCGHSFGSTGIVRYLRKQYEEHRPCPFRGTFLLDLWGGPLTEADREHGVQIPSAFLLSEGFAENGAPITKAVIGRSGEKCIGIASIKGTRHQWISESHYFFPKWLLRKLGIMGPADFQKAHAATMKASQLAVEALLDANLQPSFQEKLLSMDQDLIAAV